MQITVRLFGPEARMMGCREVMVDAVIPISCRALGELLARQHPRLGAVLGRCRFAVNHEFAEASGMIHEGDEVALIGQVSGG